MLSSLTSYLTQFKKVAIPFIGTFELRYQPATLDFANRLIYPPVQEVYFAPQGNVPTEQITFLGWELGLDGTTIEDRLSQCGRALKAAIKEASFSWEGFGELSSVEDAILFTPSRSATLSEVAAHKIIRQNVHHGVLVGEKQMSSGDISYIEAPVSAKRSYVNWVGWVVALLAVLFIGYQLNAKNFHPFASGLQQKPLLKVSGKQSH
ncbi:MAG: hypothetical protein WKF70_12665 [Chitinophagaceae bacterium]